MTAIEWLPLIGGGSDLRCTSCCMRVSLTVDDSDLCVRCDALLYPPLT